MCQPYNWKKLNHGFKVMLKIGSSFLVLVMFFVSMGWNVKFHYCTEDHHLSSSFVNAAESCHHCHGHEHGHEHKAHLTHHDVIQFNSKCCCEDFESQIQFTESFFFSPDKHLDIHFQPLCLVHLDLQELLPKAQQVFYHFTARKIPLFVSARELLVYFSALRLNPLVF